MRRYRLVKAPEGWPEQLEYRLHLPDGDAGVGDEFEADLSPEDEWVNLEAGLLEIVPVKYRVLAGNVDGHLPGDEFDAAVPLVREALLASHIERVKVKPAPKPRKKKEVKE